MTNRVPACLLASFFFCTVLPGKPVAAAASEDLIKPALVKIYNVESAADYDLPWDMLAPAEYFGSGSIIDGRRILTNAHVVSDSSYLEVRPYGSAKRYRADIIAVSHEADLALLGVAAEDFWTGRSPLLLGRLPEVLEEVKVYGFPLGGDSLSLSQGIVSRIEVSGYIHSGIDMLLVQIDAAVNGGNSGGPAVIDGTIAGVISQRSATLQNVNYMVPPPVIAHFLEDMADGRYDGFPELGVHWQGLENPSLRDLCGLPGDNRGILVAKVLPESPAAGILLPGDVVTALNGRAIASDGTVELRPDERVSYVHYVRLKQIGESVAFDLLRKGTPLAATVALTKAWDYHFLSPSMKYDRAPTYFVYGGMVFTPLNENFLATWGDDWETYAPSNLLVLNDAYKTEDHEEAIILSKVLPHDLNRGFEYYENTRVVNLNGRKLLNMRDLVRRIETEDGSPYLVFSDEDGDRIVVDRKRAEAARAEILDIYGIPADRSEDLKAGAGTE